MFARLPEEEFSVELVFTLHASLPQQNLYLSLRGGNTEKEDVFGLGACSLSVFDVKYNSKEEFE